MSSSQVTLIAGGTCSITASQVGNASYLAATPVTKTFQVNPEAQTIAFAALADHNLGGAPFTISASATSGLTVSFASLTASVCSVTGSTVTLLNVGTCSIQGTQAGNASFLAASPVTQGFGVSSNVSGKVSVGGTGFVRDRATGIWSSTMTVTNTGGAAITGPIQVVLTALSSNATMINNTGLYGGSPYITTSAGSLAAGAQVSVTIQFQNPTNGFITYTPVTYSGVF